MESFLVNSVKMDKLYLKTCHDAVSDYHLTRNEVICLLFLQNNKPFDSAKDIAQYRKISKGLVAKSVESLIKSGYLTVVKDTLDSRILHLHTTKECEPILIKLAKARTEFHNRLMAGISDEDRLMLDKISQRMTTNLEGMIS
ncbi:MAG TPA: MarR family transcriptional regulator [Lachnoclostridium phytofermentans]|uniref:MarR family transcriptional regulator n=1 Tax=Lachnoclostridium phytofermentans TaxID=66219 RepID=A0A3D2X5J7_9FIRM|nr:MarR family transcriptional regulator [Lachnoclostridium sp.]HCL02411.1 MarR family transcriptional regulator [Lachnoclostridium phytofermentans]